MLRTLPYTPPQYPDNSYKRVLVTPIPKEEETTASGLIVPTDIGSFCEIGIVYACDEDSTIKIGDKVYYNKIDRTNTDQLDTVSIDGKKYDCLYENEMWSVNDQPFNRIFVEATSDLSISEGGLIIPGTAGGVTQKGIVFRAPSHYSVQPGDHIEYRKQERDIYPTVFIDNVRYEVLHEADVFMVNDQVAPFFIIVKIDIGAQTNKRHTTETGLIRSQLFIHMLHNMQVGEVIAIGKEATKNFPDLRVGDSAILHHFIEAQPWRLLKQEKGKHAAVAYEYRLISGFEANSREIFGKVVNRKEEIFYAYGNHEFLDWNFDVLGQHKVSALLEFEGNLDRHHNLEELKSAIASKQKEGFDKAKAKIKGTTDILSRVNPNTDKDRYDELESQLAEAQREAVKIGNYVQANHMLACTVLGTKKRVLTSYKELYPINVFGKKFLIANKDFIAAELEADI